jgi:Protein of unknown function (DUF2752)
MNLSRRSIFAMPRGARLASWALACGAIAVLLYVVDPAGATWLPKCPVHLLTGWHCPGCGSTRAAHALLHLDVGRALSNNPLMVFTAPLAVAFCAWNRWQRGPNWTTMISTRSIVVVLAVLVGFAIVRNVPSYPFSLLAPH